MSINAKTMLQLEHVGFSYSSGIGLFGGTRIPALKDVSFAVREGETLGLIGRNGCGKSTLLRIMTGIFKADTGRVVRNCNRISLLSLGVAFDRLLSGSDNLILSCMLLGASRKEALAMHDDIVAYAELEDFIDQPVKTYSSGMKARLGFAVGMQMQADLILIDEVLGVGDARFRKKATETMRERVKSDQSVLFVSHSMPTVRSLCTRVIWLEQGRIHMEGEVDEVVNAYETFMQDARGVGSGLRAKGRSPSK